MVRSAMLNDYANIYGVARLNQAVNIMVHCQSQCAIFHYLGFYLSWIPAILSFQNFPKLLQGKSCHQYISTEALITKQMQVVAY